MASTSGTAGQDRRNPGPSGSGAVAPRNYLRACLLLLIHERPDYGYDLVERLKPLGLDQEDPGAVYRTLRWMERDGLVRSGWGDSCSGPLRRTYTMTPEGEEAARSYGYALDGCRRTIEGFLDRFLDAFEPLGAGAAGSRQPALHGGAGGGRA